MINVYDPRGERISMKAVLAPRPASLSGLTIGLLDNGKENGDALLARCATRLSERGARILNFSKPSFSRAAPDDVLDSLAHCNAVIAAHGG